ncbi:MAG: RNase P subunit p30 family protein [Candidatus Diapherotrites archaeon]|nr:hypothetical protein [Candidatus Micrarchaeota archaeon]
MAEISDIILFSDFAGIEKTAKALGFDSSAIAVAANSREDAERVRNAGFKVCKIIEKRDSRELKRWRNWADIVAVRGGSPEMNKFGVSKGVDFLLAPCGTARSPFDTQTAQSAKDAGVSVALPFSELLNMDKYRRAMLLKNYFMAVKICKKKKLPFAVFSCALRADEMRMPENMRAIARLLGYA